jgi:hypothetical protein
MHPSPRPVVRLFVTLLGACPLLAGCGDPMAEYASAEGGFRLRLPAGHTPEPPVKLARGMHKVSLVLQSGTFEIAWQDRAAGDDLTPDQRLDRACDGAVRALKGKELARKEITLGGAHPGRELLAEWPDHQGVVRDRLYLVGRRLYQVVASGPRWWVDARQAREVLDSFHADDE